MIVRLAFLYQIRSIPFLSSPAVDGRFYDQWAQRIAAGQWWGGEVFFLAPVYPYFLAAVYTLFGRSLMTVHVIQMLLGAMSCVLLFGAGRRFFGHPSGLIAGLLLALYPPAVFFDGILHKASLLLFLTTLFLYLLSTTLERGTWRKFLACGMVVGLLALTQENILILLLIVPLWILLRRGIAATAGKWRMAGAFVAGGASLLTIVAVRNYSVGSVLALTTSNVGQNFYIGNNPDSTGLYESFFHGRQDPVQERADAIRIAQQTTGRELTPGEASAFWLRRGLDFVREQPGRWLGLLVRKVRLVWNRFEIPDAEDIELYAEWSPLLGAALRVFHFGILAPLGLMGVAITFGQWRRVWIIHLMLFAITVSVALFFVFARFRLPLVPMLALTGGAGVATLRQRLSARRIRPLVVASAVAVAAAIATNAAVVDERPYHSIGFVNLGSLLRQQDRFEEADHFLRRAIAAYPDNEFAWYQLGLVDRHRGRYEDAEADLTRACVLVPTFAEPQLALGRMLAERNRLDEAVARYRQAIQLKPDERTPRLELARILEEMGRREDAIRELDLLVRLAPIDTAAREELGRLTGETPHERPAAKDDVEVLIRNANDAAAIGRYGDAIGAYKLALERSADDVRAHLGLASAYLSTQRPNEAAQHLERAIELDPNLGQAHVELGRILADQGNTESAIGHYRRALAIDPKSIPARYNLSTALAAIGRLDEAIAAMEVCLQQARAADRSELIPRIEDRLTRLRAQQRPP